MAPNLKLNLIKLQWRTIMYFTWLARDHSVRCTRVAVRGQDKLQHWSSSASGITDIKKIGAKVRRIWTTWGRRLRSCVVSSMKTSYCYWMHSRRNKNSVWWRSSLRENYLKSWRMIGTSLNKKFGRSHNNWFTHWTTCIPIASSIETWNHKIFSSPPTEWSSYAISVSHEPCPPTPWCLHP